MQKETPIEVLETLLKQLDEDRNVDAGVRYRVPTSDYVCPELAAQEWRTFFQNHPQFIGLSGDLPESGSYFTTEAFGTPVLATRSRDGAFHAFIDACRHRGVRVSPDERGRSLKFTCPFHSWTYGSDGALLAVPREGDFGAVEKSCNSSADWP